MKKTTNIYEKWTDKKFPIDILKTRHVSRIFEENRISIKEFITYIENDSSNIIKDKMQEKLEIEKYDILKNEIENTIINFFKKYHIELRKNSFEYQENRFFKKYTMEKIKYFYDVLSYGPSMLINEKIFIPCNMYYYLGIVDLIINEVIKQYNFYKNNHKTMNHYHPIKTIKYEVIVKNN